MSHAWLIQRINNVKSIISLCVLSLLVGCGPQLESPEPTPEPLPEDTPEVFERELRATIMSDGSAADVQAKINAAAGGAVIGVPEGTFTWSTLVSNVTPSGPKSVTIQGAGVGRTIVKDAKASGTLVLLDYSNLPNGRPRMTGIEFVDGGRTTQESVPMAIIKIKGSNTNGGAARIDHCKTYHLNGHHIGTETAIGSVIDHCDVIYHKNTYCWAMAETYDGGTWGDRSWMKPSNFGTNDFVFFEDCLFQQDSQYYASVDVFGGGRYVQRYCRYVNTHPGGHGTEGQRRRGVRAAEIYNNTSDHTLGGILVNCRGGDWLIHDNTFKGVSTWGFRLQCQRIDKPMGPWGQADGTNKYDRNKNGVVEMAIDQPGAGAGGQMSGGVPPIQPAGWNDQVVDPCYAWNNTFNGQPTKMYAERYNMVDGVHFFNSSKPGYTPFKYPHPLVSGGPVPSPVPTSAPSASPTRTPTSTATPVATSTPQPTATTSATSTRTPTATATPTTTSTPQASVTPPSTVTPVPSPVPVLAAPSSLTARVVQGKRVQLTWNDNAGTEERQELVRSDDNCVTWLTAGAIRLSSNQESYLDQTTAKKKKYCYRVRACTQSGCSGWSNQVTITP